MSELPAIIKRALTETVTDIGQLSKEDKKLLTRYVKLGYLAKGKGGAYPNLKTVYAYPGYNFQAERERMIKEMFAICKSLGEKL